MKPWEREKIPYLSSRNTIEAQMGKKLKAPFPYFGGKSSVSSLVWDRLGDCDNVIEPFCGSAAFLLARPHPPRIETLNDADCFVANFWRSVQADPEAVAYYADAPVNEADLHARHRWLVGVPSSPWTDTPYLHAMAGPDRLETDRREFRRRMRTDPDYYCTRTAGWWCWGLCCWIGSGWCQTNESAQWQQCPDITSAHGVGKGVHANGPAGGSGDPLRRNEGATPALAGSDGKGQGVVRNGPAGGSGERAPRLSKESGVHAKGELHEKRPMVTGFEGQLGRGVHARGPDDTHRPQLADAYSLGRGVHAGPLDWKRFQGGKHNNGLHCGPQGTCAQRRAWLVDWFNRLQDRLRCVRVCCGSWERVCSSESVTTRLGTTGVFLDPPYSAGAGRDSKIYSVDSLTVAEDVRQWCMKNGLNPQMRIALCGYAGEGHEVLEMPDYGWQVVEWKAAGGYGNRSAKGKANAKKERIWFSPFALNERTLFDGLE